MSTPARNRPSSLGCVYLHRVTGLCSRAVVASRAFSPSLLVLAQDLLNHADNTLTQYGFERPDDSGTEGESDG